MKILGASRGLSPGGVATALIWLGFAALPATLDDWMLSQLSIYFAYGLLAISLAFVWGHCGLLCLGQAVFFGIGGYAMSVATLGLLPGAPGLISSWVGLILAAAIPMAVANALGRFLFMGGGVHGAFFGIITLAVAVIAERVAINWDYLGGLNGLMNVPFMNLGLNGDGYEIWDSLPTYYFNLAVAALVYLAMSALVASPYGAALKAVRDNETRTRAFGYDAAAYKVTAFTIGAGIAGLAGALFVAQFGFSSPTLIGFGLSAQALIWTALGGRGVMMAAFLGAVAVRAGESELSERLGDIWPLAMGALFVAAVIWFPRGLFGEAYYAIERLGARRR